MYKVFVLIKESDDTHHYVCDSKEEAECLSHRLEMSGIADDDIIQCSPNVEVTSDPIFPTASWIVGPFPLTVKNSSGMHFTPAIHDVILNDSSNCICGSVESECDTGIYIKDGIVDDTIGHFIGASYMNRYQGLRYLGAETVELDSDDPIIKICIAYDLGKDVASIDGINPSQDNPYKENTSLFIAWTHGYAVTKTFEESIRNLSTNNAPIVKLQEHVMRNRYDSGC